VVVIAISKIDVFDYWFVEVFLNFKWTNFNSITKSTQIGLVSFRLKKLSVTINYHPDLRLNFCLFLKAFECN
jgi:hypothetical protein